MPSGLTQQGTTLKVGFGSFSYTAAYIPEDGLTWKKSYGNIEEITDANGDMFTKILMDPRDEFGVTLILKGTAATIIPPAQGDTITITNPDGDSVVGMVRDATMTFARGATRLTLDIVKEESMTYIP